MKTKDPPHSENTGSQASAPVKIKVDETMASMPSASQQRNLTTEEAAVALNLRPQSIRKRHSQTGAYFSVRPIKLPNGRLRWPANLIELLTNPKV